MKSILILSIVFAMTLPCCAADSLVTAPAFRIIDYKPVGFRTQSLILTPSFNFYDNSTMDTSSSLGGTTKDASGDGNLSASARHSLRNQTNSTDLEVSTNVNLAGFFFASTQERTDNAYDTKSYSVGREPEFNYWISNSTRSRKYISSTLFLEGVITPSIAHEPLERRSGWNSSISKIGADSSRYQGYKTVNNSRRITLASGLNAGLGTGWIADMTGAAIALHMADCIGRLKASPRKLTSSQLQDLSLTIDRLRRRRIFDTRTANIESVDTLCQFLLSEKCVDTASVRLAMEINDIWDYGFTQQRHFGKEIKVSPTATVYYNHTGMKSSYSAVDSIGPTDPSITTKDVSGWPMTLTSTDDSHWTQLFLTYGGVVNASFSKPCGRYFEVDGSAEISGTMNTLYDSTSATYQGHGKFRGTYPDATGKLSLSLTWFPTLRATISLYNQLTVSADFLFRSRTISDTTDLSSWEYTQRRLYMTAFSTGMSVRYFLSPRFSYDMSGSVQYASGTKRAWAGAPFSYGSELRRWYFAFGTDLAYSVF